MKNIITKHFCKPQWEVEDTAEERIRKLGDRPAVQPLHSPER